MKKTLLILLLLAGTVNADVRVHFKENLGASDLVLMDQAKEIKIDAKEPMMFEYISRLENRIDTSNGRVFTTDLYMDKRCQKNPHCQIPAMLFTNYADPSAGGHVVYYDLKNKKVYSVLPFTKGDVSVQK